MELWHCAPRAWRNNLHLTKTIFATFRVARALRQARTSNFDYENNSRGPVLRVDMVKVHRLTANAKGLTQILLRL